MKTQVVPVKMTQEMKERAQSEIGLVLRAGMPEYDLIDGVEMAWRAALDAAPTPPAQDDEPVAWAACNVGLGDSLKELIVRCRAQMEMYREMGWVITPLYTRPDNSDLRKAAEGALELLEFLRDEGYFKTIGESAVIADLRAALEGK